MVAKAAGVDPTKNNYIAYSGGGEALAAILGNQVTAGVLTFGLWFVFFILGKIGDGMPEKIATPSAWPTTVTHSVLFLYGILRGLVRELPLDAHAAHMAQGAADGNLGSAPRGSPEAPSAAARWRCRTA